MLHLLAQLYADDGFRFTLWHVLHNLHVDGTVIALIRDTGHVIFEDFSVK